VGVYVPIALKKSVERLVSRWIQAAEVGTETSLPIGDSCSSSAQPWFLTGTKKLSRCFGCCCFCCFC
jgi:hypothetical protein